MSHTPSDKARELDKAYGGCHKCYGKGYATVISGTTGYEDFGGDGFVDPPRTHMQYCTCERGTQLEALIATKQLEELKALIANYAGTPKGWDTNVIIPLRILETRISQLKRELAS